MQQSFHDFKMKSINNELIDFSRYKGKKVIVLNTASECGYTPQYAEWQQFHEQHKDDFVVIGFPTNDFGGQEPGSNEDISTFCQVNYGVSFQMMEKINVLGPEQHPLYKWLSSKELNGWNDQAATWNFCKYLINDEGQLIDFFPSAVTPEHTDFKKAAGI